MIDLVVIIGPTASGKSALAMTLAKQSGGEIICADSRTIYRGMDIGTAKPSKTDQAEVPHHLLDLVNPDQAFSAAEFKSQATAVIKEIQDRGNLPILVGGSGLYIDAVLYDYQFPAGADNALRQELNRLSIDQLVERLRQVDPERVDDIDLKNSRRVIRAVETAGKPKLKSELIDGAIIIGLNSGMDKLKSRIKSRVDVMVAQDFSHEVKRLADKFGWDNEAMTSIGYRAFRDYIDHRITLKEAKEAFVNGDIALAKRQLTWFKRNPDINWFSSAREAEQFVLDRLKRGRTIIKS